MHRPLGSLPKRSSSQPSTSCDDPTHHFLACLSWVGAQCGPCAWVPCGLTAAHKGCPGVRPPPLPKGAPGSSPDHWHARMITHGTYIQSHGLSQCAVTHADTPLATQALSSNSRSLQGTSSSAPSSAVNTCEPPGWWAVAVDSADQRIQALLQVGCEPAGQGQDPAGGPSLESALGAGTKTAMGRQGGQGHDCCGL